jgi:hypothetical protein
MRQAMRGRLNGRVILLRNLAQPPAMLLPARCAAVSSMSVTLQDRAPYVHATNTQPKQFASAKASNVHLQMSASLIDYPSNCACTKSHHLVQLPFKAAVNLEPGCSRHADTSAVDVVSYQHMHLAPAAPPCPLRNGCAQKHNKRLRTLAGRHSLVQAHQCFLPPYLPATCRSNSRGHRHHLSWLQLAAVGHGLKPLLHLLPAEESGCCHQPCH